MEWLAGNCSSVWRRHSRCCKGQGAGECPSRLLDCSLDLCSHHIYRQAVSNADFEVLEDLALQRMNYVQILLVCISCQACSLFC